MADLAIEVFISEHHQRCVKALQQIAQLADTHSDAYKEFSAPYLRMGDKPSGWRIVEAMREVAVEILEHSESEDTP